MDITQLTLRYASTSIPGVAVATLVLVEMVKRAWACRRATKPPSAMIYLASLLFAQAIVWLGWLTYRGLAAGEVAWLGIMGAACANLGFGVFRNLLAKANWTANDAAKPTNDQH